MAMSLAFAPWPPVTERTNPPLRGVQSLTCRRRLIKQIIDKS